jgi:hypothetical protein
MQRVQPDALTPEQQEIELRRKLQKELLEDIGRFMNLNLSSESRKKVDDLLDEFMLALERAQPKEEDPRQMRLFD